MNKNIGPGESSLREESAHRPAHGGRRLVPEDVKFIWGVGIESSSIPHLDVDQFEWTQHNQNWRADLQLVSQELGLRHLRYSIPWHYIQPRRGQFDWSVADERIGYALKLGQVAAKQAKVMAWASPVALILLRHCNNYTASKRGFAKR